MSISFTTLHEMLMLNQLFSTPQVSNKIVKYLHHNDDLELLMKEDVSQIEALISSYFMENTLCHEKSSSDKILQPHLLNNTLLNKSQCFTSSLLSAFEVQIVDHVTQLILL